MNINITPEEARAILYELHYCTNTQLINKLEKITKFPEKDFDDCFVTGFDILGNSRDGYLPGIYFKDDVRQTTFRTQEQANAARALAQLTQWYGEVSEKDKIMNPSDGFAIKNNNSIGVQVTNYHPHTINSFLHFKTREIAREFLESHKTLIEQAKYFL